MNYNKKYIDDTIKNIQHHRYAINVRYGYIDLPAYLVLPLLDMLEEYMIGKNIDKSNC